MENKEREKNRSLSKPWPCSLKEVEKWYRLRICIYIDWIVKRHEGFIYQVQKCLNMLTLWKFQNGNESMWILLIGLWVRDVYDYDGW